MITIKKTIRQTCLSLTVSLLLAAPCLLQADDTDAMTGNGGGTSNVLFVMDLSGSMATPMNDSTRLVVLKEALTEIIEQASPSMRIGLMSFGRGEQDYVQGVQFPISDITSKAADLVGNTTQTDNFSISPSKDETTQSFLARITRQWEAFGATPIVDALYEAALYFRGETIDWGNAPVGSMAAAHPLSFNPNSKKYISPITHQCQANYMVLLSDGSPTFNLVANTPLAQRIKSQGCSATPVVNGQCGREITQMLLQEDNSSTVEGPQSIQTFAVGFGNIDDALQNYMRSLVTATDDLNTPEREGYFTAQNKDQLVSAFSAIFDNIAKNTPTYSNPSYSLDTSNNGMSHDGNVYVPMVEPGQSTAWFGNLKKFKINTSGKDRYIVGKDGQPAFTDTGEIKDTTVDFWSQSGQSDGKNPLAGGVASVLKKQTPGKRLLYSNITQESLTAVSNRISTSNSRLTTDLLEASNSERSALIHYIQGLKTDENSQSLTVSDKGIGDILHFDPLTITYGDNKKYVLVGTNEGFLHAFDEDNGEEAFAFMPKALLPNIKKRYENKALSDDNLKVYGVDGKATLWHNDLNQDGKVDSDDGEHAYLYFGLRRGGTGFYALDITHINKPSLLWAYNTDGSNKTLGQSWSKPYLSRVFDKDNVLRKVIVISGGYDTIHDNPENINKHVSYSVGNNIVILDAESGGVLWSLKGHLKEGASQLKNSIPGGVRVLDMNKNGALDRMYFADTGGNIWRLDINESLDQSESFKEDSQLTQLASLGGDNEEARQFYNEPELSILKHKTITTLALAVGSGLRPHPKDEIINDHLFVLLDRYVNSFPPKTSTNTQLSPLDADNTQTTTNTVEEESSKDYGTCLIYNATNQPHQVTEPATGNSYTSTKITDLLLCTNTYISPPIKITTLNDSDQWTFSPTIQQATGKNCKEITVGDYVPTYTETKNNTLLNITVSNYLTRTNAITATFNDPDNPGETENIDLRSNTTQGISKLRVCETYDDPSMDPSNFYTEKNSIIDKISMKRWNDLKALCSSSTASCSEQMSYDEAIDILIGKDDDDDESNNVNSGTSTNTTLTDSNSDTSKIITLDQLAAIKTNTTNGQLDLDYGKLTNTNLIDAGLAGWHFELANPGEKSLSDAMTHDGTIFFTSYLPQISQTVDENSGCSGSTSGGRLYAFDILKGTPSLDLNQDGVINEQDLYLTASSQAIPSRPQLVYNEPTCDEGSCTHPVDIRINTMSKQAASYDRSGLQSIYWVVP